MNNSINKGKSTYDRHDPFYNQNCFLNWMK